MTLTQVPSAPIRPAAAGTSTNVDVLIWVGALIAAVLVLGMVILLLRKRLFIKDGDDAGGMLSDLRRMHKSGELTTEEYDAARRALTFRVAGRADAPRAVPPPGQRPSSAAQATPAGELRARPGFDLTGAPLPRPMPSNPPSPPLSPPRTPPAGGNSAGESRDEPNPYDRKPPSV